MFVSGCNRKEISFENLPVLVTECILSHLNYSQVLRLRLLSRDWDSFIKEYLTKADKRFQSHLTKYHVQWVAVKEQVEDSPNMAPFSTGGSSNKMMKKLRTTPRMSPRIYHLSCYVDDYMYVFGGCVSYQTAYNDLWRFDVERKKWLRIIAEGTIPLPRIFSSFTLYNCHDEQTGETKQYIVLFGGFLITERIHLSIYLSDQVLKTIHLFDIENNRWTLIDVKGKLELKSCCHSAVIVGHELIVANGLTFVNNQRSSSPNDVFVFDLRKHCWRQQPTEGSSDLNNASMLESFFNQFEIKSRLPKLFPNAFVLDRQHILFVGFSVSRTSLPLASILECDDQKSYWKWSPVKFCGFELDSKTGSICQIGNMLAYLSIKNGYFVQISLNRNAGCSGGEINHHYHPSNRRHTLHERRIELLDYYQQFFFDANRAQRRGMANGETAKASLTMEVHKQKITLQLNLLDLSKTIQEGIITKLKQHHPIDYTVAPDAFPYYSLVPTPTSLILFGSCSEESSENFSVCNKLFLLVARPRDN